MSASALIASSRPSAKSRAVAEAEDESAFEGFDMEKFQIAAVADPGNFLKDHYFTAPAKPTSVNFSKGTTTLSFVWPKGIVVAVDSRATQGSYIASQSVQKVIEINPYLLGTMAGGAADCQFWERELGRRCRLYELREKERITVSAASKILARILYSYRGYGLSVGTMVCGWDKTGPNIFYVDSDGTRLNGKRFSVGSGSTFAYGVLDSGFDENMSVEEACELGRRSIYHATHRDAYSGGYINVYYINENGWTKISRTDCFELHQKYLAEHEAVRAAAAGNTATAMTM